MKYLFIGAHVDDVELSCGATVCKLLESGNDVTVITLTTEYGINNLMGEWLASMRVLKPTFIWAKDFHTRHFLEYKSQILDYLLMLKDYDFVFSHSCNDLHQDHQVLGCEAMRAFKFRNLLSFTGDWNQRTATKNYFIPVEKHHIEKKIESLNCYESQKNRPYMNADYIYANALSNGIMCGHKYAESFEVINLIQ